MNRETAIAVVIPAWRQPGLLPEAIASVLGQEGLGQEGLGQEGAPPIAALVVDDGYGRTEGGSDRVVGE